MNASQDRSPVMSQAPRMTGSTVCLPIVYGSMAFPLKKVEENNTHQWYLYIRGPCHEDLSRAVLKVIFQLHPSFAQPVREITKAPFAIKEKGWGEFDVTIRVFWRDESEKPLVLTTPLQLYPSDSNHKIGDPVIHETYDEVVFTDPNEKFYKQLMLGDCSESLNDSLNFPKVYFSESAVQERLPMYSDEEDVKALLEAQKFLSVELSSVKDRIIKANQAKKELDHALSIAALKKVPGATMATSAAATGSTKSGAATNISNNTITDQVNIDTLATSNKAPTSKRAKKSTPVKESNIDT